MSFYEYGDDDVDMDAIIKSIEVNEIDKSSVGSLLVQPSDESFKKITMLSDVGFSAPSIWTEVYGSDSDTAMVTDNIASVVISYNDSYRAQDVVEGLYKSCKAEEKEFKSIKIPEYYGIGDKKGFHTVFSYLDNKGKTYVNEIFAFNEGSECVLVIIDIPIEYWGQKYKDIYSKVINSVEFK